MLHPEEHGRLAVWPQPDGQAEPEIQAGPDCFPGPFGRWQLHRADLQQFVLQGEPPSSQKTNAGETGQSRVRATIPAASRRSASPLRRNAQYVAGLCREPFKTPPPLQPKTWLEKVQPASCGSPPRGLPACGLLYEVRAGGPRFCHARLNSCRRSDSSWERMAG
jgi:hypothetical protein